MIRALSDLWRLAFGLWHRAAPLRIPVACSLWLVACGLAACTRPRRAPVAEPWEQREFLIGLREAPPQEDARYAQVAKAGFNTIVSYVGPDALALAQRHGLRLAVSKIGLEIGARLSADSLARAEAHIERFGDHRALWGYYLGDRLREGRVGDCARVADFVRGSARGRPFYIELLGCDAWAGPALRTADYPRYLDRVIRTVRPPLLVFAHHPFRGEADSPCYFENLALVRRAALGHGLPFAQAIRCGQWPTMRELGEGELRWLVYTSLAYGARGIVWWGYWQSRDGKGRGIVAPDGTPTDRYRWVAALNAEVAALGPHLLRLRSEAVYHTGDRVPAGATRLPPHGLVRAVGGGSFVVGLFRCGAGQRHLLVVNADYRKPADAALTVNRRCHAVACLDPASGRWRDLPCRTDRLQTTLGLPLPPGGGRLLRIDLTD